MADGVRQRRGPEQSRQPEPGERKTIAPDGKGRRMVETNSALVASVILGLIALRAVVGTFGHSGQGQPPAYEGAPWGGDYEAQRHWMEVTINLPVGQWYWYDLQYWGLDYPPLTAYVSWLCGFLSAKWEPSSMTLLASRGYETTMHKVFMRLTVLVLDVVIYFSAVWVLSRRMIQTSTRGNTNVSWVWSMALALCQPALVLVDHGHFQYNTVSLGLSLWAFYFMTLPRESARPICWSDIVGSVFFALGLNFKQMSLYHAPAVFFILLGRCFFSKSIVSVITSVAGLGIAVVGTFVALWWPFCAYAGKETSCVEGLAQIVHRLFPFARGIFEDKVANLWFVLSVKPISIRSRIPLTVLPIVALALTILLLVVPGCRLFSAGMHGVGPRNQDREPDAQDDGGLRALLWGATATSFAFFLAAFQVHEKSLLLALAPLSLLQVDSPKFVAWVSLLGAWSMYPLLEKDGLQVPYMVTMGLFAVLSLVMMRGARSSGPELGPYALLRIFGGFIVGPASLAAVVAIHALNAVRSPPASMPDLWPTLWAIVGCGTFCLAYLVIITRQWD